MVDNNRMHQFAGVTARSWMLAPPQQRSYFLSIDSLYLVSQAAVDAADPNAITDEYTRRVIEFSDAGTDQDQVSIDDGTNPALIFELDLNGIPLDGGGAVDVDCNNSLSANDSAKRLYDAIRAQQAAGNLRTTFFVELIGPVVILRNDRVAAPTDDLLVVVTATSMVALTYLLFKPHLFQGMTPSVPDYCCPAVTVEPDQGDNGITSAIVEFYGRDPFDNPIMSRVPVYANGEDGERIPFYADEGFARVDEIRVINPVGAEALELHVDDRMDIGYYLPVADLISGVVLPSTWPPGVGTAPYMDYVGTPGAWNPFLHVAPVTGKYAGVSGRKAASAAGMHIEGVSLEFDTTGLNAQNLTANDVLHISDSDEDLFLTFVAVPLLPTDVRIGANATENALNTIATIEALYAARATRFRAERYTDRIAPARGFVLVWGGKENMLVELFNPEVGPNPFASLIANTEVYPYRYFQMDTSLFTLAATTTVHDGDLLILEEDGVRDIYEFDNNATVVPGHVDVAIGVNKATTMATLATEINSNGAALTNWKAINVSSAPTYVVRLVNANGSGRIYVVSSCNLNAWQASKTPMLKRIPILKSLCCMMNLQAIGAYDPATGAPRNSVAGGIFSPFQTYTWDLFDASHDPYGYRAVGAAGVQANLGFRAMSWNPLANYGELPVAGGCTHVMYFVANTGIDHTLLKDYHSDFVLESGARQRTLPGSPHRGDLLHVSQRPAPPYFNLPDRSGGQR